MLKGVFGGRNKVSVKDLYNQLVSENETLLEQTSQAIKRIHEAAKKNAAKKDALLLLAETLQAEHDIRTRYTQVLKQQRDDWRGLLRFDKVLQDERRKELTQSLEYLKTWREKLKDIEALMTS